MHRYHPKKELAPRDIVARAIDNELKKRGDDCVYLDIRHRPARYIRKRFPEIYKKCLEFGIDITKKPIPVVPAAHYFCGGVKVNEWGETNLPGLFAVGEVSYTGLHGANRLASNSLLECVVYANRAAQKARLYLNDPLPKSRMPDWDPGKTRDPDDQVVVSQYWDEMRRVLWNYVGIERSDERLVRALRRSELINKEIQEYCWDYVVTPELLEMRNVALLGDLVVRSALARHESRGLHYNRDHPKRNDHLWRKTTTIVKNRVSGRAPVIRFESL